MKIRNLEPILCMKRDEEALEFCLDRIRVSEPVSIVTVNGNGKDIIYETLLWELITKKDRLPILSAQLVFEEDVRAFVKKIKKQVLPLLCVINLSIEKDVSWLLDELEGLRRKNGILFSYVVLSYFTPLAVALDSRKKTIFRSLKVLPCIDLKDTNTLIKDFGRRFKYNPNSNRVKEIHRLSGGHVGIVKSIYLFLRTDQNVRLNASDLAQEPSILYRLVAIRRDLANKGSIRFDIKTPLLKNVRPDILDVELIFTGRETELWNLFVSEVNKFVTREKIAQIIWKENFEEKYSDWAIDQTVHRIRSKLKKVRAPYKLLTKKGRGFILQEK